MRKIEFILGTFSLIAITLKLLQVSGGDVLSMWVLSALSLFYYLISFAYFNDIKLRNIFKKESYKVTNAKKIIGAIGLGFALSATVIGCLYKLQFYFGADTNLLIGLVTLLIILIIAIIFYFRNKTNFYVKIFKRIFIIGGLGLILYLTPHTTLVNIYYRNYPDYANALNKAMSNPDDNELWKKVDEEKQKMYDQQR